MTESWNGAGTSNTYNCSWQLCINDDILQSGTEPIPLAPHILNGELGSTTCSHIEDHCLYMYLETASGEGLGKLAYVVAAKRHCVNDTCKEGYRAESISKPFNAYPEACISGKMPDHIEYTTCVPKCNNCNNSCQTTGFVDYGQTNCQRRVVKSTCNENSCQCESEFEAQCKPGYYGTPNAQTCAGCQKCPDLVDAAGKTFPGTSTPGDNDKKEKCYLPSDATNDIEDEKGTFYFSESCYTTAD